MYYIPGEGLALKVQRKHQRYTSEGRLAKHSDRYALSHKLGTLRAVFIEYGSQLGDGQDKLSAVEQSETVGLTLYQMLL
jgi:hypothetical protein